MLEINDGVLYCMLYLLLARVAQFLGAHVRVMENLLVEERLRRARLLLLYLGDALDDQVGHVLDEVNAQFLQVLLEGRMGIFIWSVHITIWYLQHNSFSLGDHH